MEKSNTKFRRYFKRKKYSKNHKTLKKSNYYIKNIKRNIKIISIVTMIIVFCLIYKKEMNQVNNNNKVNNNNWMKNNMSEYIMNYFSSFKGNYNKRVSYDIIRLREYFALKVIIKNGNLTLNLETKEKLKKN